MLENFSDSESPSPSTPLEVQDSIRLQVGHCMMFRERYPVNQNPEDCFSEESAYFLQLEKEYLTIPPNLHYSALADQIEPKCKNSIQIAWTEVCLKRREFEDTFRNLQSRWTETPLLAMETFNSQGKTTKKIIDNYPLPVPKNHRKGIIHTTTPSFKKIGESSRLRKWQIDERALRGKFYTDHRDYMTTLRLYYELLLESNPKGTQKAIPNNPELREEINRRNFIARIINTAYQCIQIAKAKHYEQPQGRLRKYEGIPYAMHTLRVTLAALLDTLPFIKLDGSSSIKPTLLAAAGPMHDTVEDTLLTLNTIMKALSSKADYYDTSVDPRITPQFTSSKGEAAVEEFKTNQINLINHPETLRQIERILRILTDSIPGKEYQENKAPLSNAEIATAINQNIFGEKQTLFHLGLLSEEDLNLSENELRPKIKAIRVKYNLSPLVPPIPPSKTSGEFPEDHDNGKLTRFIIRANAIAKTGKQKGKKKKRHLPNPSAGTILQHALILKFEDRANNLITKPIETTEQSTSKLRDLRNAFERLIYWIITDYDNVNFPLYNAIPRLIHACLKSYEELTKRYPELIEDLDKKYITNLETWAKGEIEITRFQTSSKISSTLEAYAEKNPQDQYTTRQFANQ